MKTIYNNKLNNPVNGKKSFLRFLCCSSLAAVAMLAMLTTSCQKDEATAPVAGGTPLAIGMLSVQGTDSEATASTRAYTGDGYTSWQWGEGEEIIVQAGNPNVAVNYKSTYVLGSDGSWAVKPGSTLITDGNGSKTYLDAIYTQDVDGGDYQFKVNSFGGIAESTLGEAAAWVNNSPFYPDQNTKTRYQGTDYLEGTATLGADHALTATLLHQCVDVAIIVKRGTNWGSTEEAARTAFLAHITDKAAPKMPTNYGNAVTPFCSYKSGDEAVYRAHIPVLFVHKGDASGIYSVQTITVGGAERSYINGTLVNAQILKLTHVNGAELTATYNLTSDATSGIMQGKRLTVTITYDNVTGLSTQGASIGNWTTVNGGEMEGNYTGTLN